VLNQSEETEVEKRKKERDEKDSLELQQAILSKREKRERKKELMRKRKAVKKVQLKITQPGDTMVDGEPLFQISNLEGMTDKDLDELAEDAKMTEEMLEHLSEEDDVDEVIWSDDDDSDEEEEGEGRTIDKMEADMNWQYEIYIAERRKRDRKSLPKVVEKDKFKRDEVKGDHVYESDEEDREMLDEADDESDTLLKTSKKNPLLVEETLPKSKKVDQWFAQDLFNGMDDFDIEQVAISAAPKRKLSDENEEQSNKRTKKSSPTSPSSPIPDQVVPQANGKKQANGKQANGKQAIEKQANGKQAKGKEVVNGKAVAENGKAAENGKQNGKEKTEKKDKKKKADEDSLDEGDNVSDDERDIGKKVQTLAIATNMLRKKERMTIEDDMFNRYTFNDEGLPDWFVKHEERYVQPNLPITKEQVQEMRRRYQEINNRPIKKVAEALARKKRRNTIKSTKAKEKAHAIAQDDTLTPGQKISQVNKIMKKANQKQGKEKVYVVAKRGSVGGMKKKRKHVNHARVKMVDKRMKKEARANTRSDKEGNRKGAKKGGKGKPKGRKGK
jgi:AdoMet-dependent rRNA methyltransferase SPB1